MALEAPDPGHDGATPPRHTGDAGRERLLALKVSRVIDAHPEALGVLIAGGFTPLANPAMRLALAPTVTLGQALRVRGLDEAAGEALLERLLALGVGAGEG